jgi:hypothetical protein
LLCKITHSKRSENSFENSSKENTILNIDLKNLEGIGADLDILTHEKGGEGK